MRDVFWVIITVWVIYRIYQAIQSSRTYIYQKHEHHHYRQQNEGKVHVDKTVEQPQRKPNSDKGGEYIDFEEVKS